MNLEWNVFYYDFNAKEINVSNVFNHGRYKEEVEELLHKCTDIDNFSDKLRSATMYYFWSKCEWETVIYPWVGDDKAAKKIDVFWQIQNNWDRFVEYLRNVSKLRNNDVCNYLSVVGWNSIKCTIMVLCFAWSKSFHKNNIIRS